MQIFKKFVISGKCLEELKNPEIGILDDGQEGISLKGGTHHPIFRW